MACIIVLTVWNNLTKNSRQPTAKAPKGTTNSGEHEEKTKQKMHLLHLVISLHFKRKDINEKSVNV